MLDRGDRHGRARDRNPVVCNVIKFRVGHFDIDTDGTFDLPLAGVQSDRFSQGSRLGVSHGRDPAAFNDSRSVKPVTT